MASAKVQRLRQLLKCDIIPQEHAEPRCNHCTEVADGCDLEWLFDMKIDDTETLLESDDNAKHKVVFIAGFLTLLPKYCTG